MRGSMYCGITEDELRIGAYSEKENAVVKSS